MPAVLSDPRRVPKPGKSLLHHGSPADQFRKEFRGVGI